jgi:ferrous iron transport protein A
LQTTIHSLKKGEKAIIKDFDIDIVPLKLLEMGCLPGNRVELLQVAPLAILYTLTLMAHTLQYE